MIDFVNSDLATFDSNSDVNSFISLASSISPISTDTQFWIGLSYGVDSASSSDALTWVDGDSMSYNKFSGDFDISDYNLSTSSGLCTAINMSGDWELHPCSTLDEYCLVCDFDLAAMTSYNDANRENVGDPDSRLIYQLTFFIDDSYDSGSSGVVTWGASYDWFWFEGIGINGDKTGFTPFRGWYEYNSNYTIFFNWTNVGNISEFTIVGNDEDGVIIHSVAVTNDFNNERQGYAVYDGYLDYDPWLDKIGGCVYCKLDLLSNSVISARTVAAGSNQCPFSDAYTLRSDATDIINDNGLSTDSNFVFVYNSMIQYNWWDAKDYCMIHYGSSLASYHSYDDVLLVWYLRWQVESELNGNANVNSFEYEWFEDGWPWIGGNDINNESYNNSHVSDNNQHWEWSDGSEYDYSGFWFKKRGQPNQYLNQNQDCVELYSLSGFVNGSKYGNDEECNATQSSFICNINIESANNNQLDPNASYWRPVFKLTNDLSRYNTYFTSDGTLVTDVADLIEDAYEYYVNGTSTFRTLDDDYNYVVNSGEFNASVSETNFNYRSVLLDYEWDELLSEGVFDRVKVSFFKNDIEVSYWVYELDSNNDNIDWFSKDNYVDSNYGDLKIESQNFWTMVGDYGRFFFVSHRYDNCLDEGWMIVTDSNGCNEWEPSEGTYSPELRYSINYNQNRLPS